MDNDMAAYLLLLRKPLMKPLHRTVAALCIATLTPLAVAQESLEYSMARGGKLYDKWFKVNAAAAPTVPNPAYPDDGKYRGNKAADWRCKECHGWDYRGSDGRYGTGKHYTGSPGVMNAGLADKGALEAVLRNAKHGYTAQMLSGADVSDLYDFLSMGTLEMGRYISDDGQHIAGDEHKGMSYYQTLCTGCHGLEGKDEDTAPPLGQVANDNPWEALHKILNGQPGAEMPALRAFDPQVAADILSYLRTLPQE